MDQTALKVIRNGGIIVAATDTLYGMLGSALNPVVVERLYALRQRELDKPFIILISKVADLEKFKIELTPRQKNKLAELWPGPVSVILPCPHPEFVYLHRGKNSLAFRLPAPAELREFLKETGPVIAPTANPSGLPPATTIDEAKKYFDNQVDYYANANTIEGQPSTLVSMNSQGDLEVIRGILKH